MAEEKLNEVAEAHGEPMVYAKFNAETGGYEPSSEFNLTINNIEGWLCEYSKYWKLSIEVGKKQRKFNPVSEADTYDGTNGAKPETEAEKEAEDLM